MDRLKPAELLSKVPFLLLNTLQLICTVLTPVPFHCTCNVNAIMKENK